MLQVSPRQASAKEDLKVGSLRIYEPELLSVWVGEKSGLCQGRPIAFSDNLPRKEPKSGRELGIPTK